jgi:peroxiredoxin Q/BCP
MPALFVIDKAGLIRYQHYGKSMSDIPANNVVFQVVDQLLEEEREEISRKES